MLGDIGILEMSYPLPRIRFVLNCDIPIAMINKYWEHLLYLINYKYNPPKSLRLIDKNQISMQYTTLGRTGLKVSVVGLGGGGPSKLGILTGKSKRESLALLQRAYDLGINFFDTANDYGNEKILGKAFAGTKRSNIVLSTKRRSFNKDGSSTTAQQLREALEQSLQKLGTDYIDIYHVASVKPQDYPYVVTELLPVMLQMRDEGKIRFLGITEQFHLDTQHQMLQRAVQDNSWDVIMVGFNLLNQSAKKSIFPKTTEKNIGVINMFAVRRALSRPETLKQVMLELKEKGLVDLNRFDENDPLGFLVHEGGATSVPDAAYRFCRYEPGVQVVLTGTGNLEHLDENVVSLLRPPLPEADLLRLKELFAEVDVVSGN